MLPKSDAEKLSKEQLAFMKRLGKLLLPQIALQLLRDGEISIKEKTAAQIEAEVVSHVRSALAEQRIHFALGIDHATELLPEARRFLRQDKLELSALYFATYFEHRLNWLIVQVCETKGIDEPTIKQLREANIRAKCTWVMVLLGHEPLPKDKMKAIDEISEIRNAFIHYKWPTESGDTKSSQRSREQTLIGLKKADSIVRYLRKFEEGRLYNGQKSQLLSALKGRANKKTPSGKT
jgi:hypothetical protein